MESEKVKEIKKVLEMFAIDDKEMTLFQSPVSQGESCVKTIKYADILILITEFESENKSLQDLCNKTYEDLTKEIDRLESENERLVESCKNCHYIKDLEIANGHAKELKDRIAELEKENETKTDTITDLLKKQEFYETEKLKQFVEKVAKRLININGIKQILDEILKEFLGEQQ